MTTSTKQQEFCDDEPWDMMVIPASTDPDLNVINVPQPNATSRAEFMQTYISNTDRFDASEKHNALQWLPELLLATQDDDDATACIQIVNTIHDRFARPSQRDTHGGNVAHIIRRTHRANANERGRGTYKPRRFLQIKAH